MSIYGGWDWGHLFKGCFMGLVLCAEVPPVSAGHTITLN